MQTNQPMDEAQLLALIEDQLDATAAARLKAELADKPELLDRIERMRGDRAAVRGLPRPALSRDLLEALEPALARPMLLAPLSAAEYRRHHARRRPARLARFALAAAFLLVLFAGVWAASTGWLAGDRLGTPDDERILASRTPGEGMVERRARTDANAPIGSDLLASAEDVEPFDRVTVHHLPPPADVRTALSDASLGHTADSARPGASLPASDTAGMVEAPFVLVIDTHDLERAVALLGESAGTEHAPVSLVRNITEKEVEDYALLLALRGAESKRLSAPTTASTDAAQRDASAPSANSPARAPGHAAGPIPGALPLGEQLAGDADRAAPVEDQLRYSSAGAQYAMTVPADRVAEVLLAISMATNQGTSLRALDAMETAAPTRADRTLSPELMWVEQLRAIRASLEQIDFSQARDVVIPVRINVREARPRR